MNLLNIIKKSKKKINFSVGDTISLELKKNKTEEKITKLNNWLVISIKNRKSVTIIKKIEEILTKRTILINSPLINNITILNKKNKKIKKSKLYNLFK